ncbi:hypothetical protein [Aestuariibacter salexigens]|uniref:hypothetical protein n=1 Tax=Aestuariibacter salexigens TaxID=226010 RepID=UPI000422B3E2|nr:hypothetical protein [Aestuariibacter salexigens]
MDEPIVKFSLKENGDIVGTLDGGGDTHHFTTTLNYHSDLYFFENYNRFELTRIASAYSVEFSLNEVEPNNKFGLSNGDELDNVWVSYRFPGATYGYTVTTYIRRVTD